MKTIKKEEEEENITTKEKKKICLDEAFDYLTTK